MKRWAIAVFVSLGAVGGSFAHPMDSPGTIYIDGVACNLPCQSYMAWSRKTLKAARVGTKGTANTSVANASEAPPKKRVAKRAVSVSATAPTPANKIGSLQTALTAPEPPSPTPMKETAAVDVETHDSAPALATSVTGAPSNERTSGVDAAVLAASQGSQWSTPSPSAAHCWPPVGVPAMSPGSAHARKVPS